MLRFGDLSVAYYAAGMGTFGIIVGVCATAILSSRALLDSVAALPEGSEA